MAGRHIIPSGPLLACLASFNNGSTLKAFLFTGRTPAADVNESPAAADVNESEQAAAVEVPLPLLLAHPTDAARSGYHQLAP